MAHVHSVAHSTDTSLSDRVSTLPLPTTIHCQFTTTVSLLLVLSACLSVRLSTCVVAYVMLHYVHYVNILGPNSQNIVKQS